MNYLTNHYKTLSEQLQAKVKELQEKLSLLEGAKEEKPLTEPSTKEGSEAKRVPLDIKTKKTDPKAEKEKTEKEDMVMKEESSVGYTLESSIKAILEGKKKHGKKERDYDTVRAKDRKKKINSAKEEDATDDDREWEVQDGPQPH